MEFLLPIMWCGLSLFSAEVGTFALTKGTLFGEGEFDLGSGLTPSEPLHAVCEACEILRGMFPRISMNHKN